MCVVDTSSIVHAWDEYPLSQFPGLWDWLSTKIGSKQLTIPEVALDECQQVAPHCAQWLKSQGIHINRTTQAILNNAKQIEGLLGIKDGNYHADGVDVNDLLIVATASDSSMELLSNEAVQQQRPKNRRKYKIPAVCALPNVQVDCRNFTAYFKLSGHVF